jgi:hypothetical protein
VPSPPGTLESCSDRVYFPQGRLSVTRGVPIFHACQAPRNTGNGERKSGPVSKTTIWLNSFQAKGYPDILTRRFLNTVCTPTAKNGWRAPRVFGLFDFDPDGMGILSVYKYSSTSLEHEGENLLSGTMEWIGLKSSDLLPSSLGGYDGDLLRLSQRDRKRAKGMLGRKPLNEGGLEPIWRREVQAMLFLNVKAEIQVLQSRQDGLSGWLLQALSRTV